MTGAFHKMEITISLLTETKTDGDSKMTVWCGILEEIKIVLFDKKVYIKTIHGTGKISASTNVMPHRLII